jgi:ubiquitin C-terminal hydrolase
LLYELRASVLIAHCPLDDKLSVGELKANINIDNPLGARGRVAMCYANLISALWSSLDHANALDSSEIKVHFDLLEGVMDTLDVVFEKNKQEDAHQLLVKLTDG